jgi:hypothetical protein
MIYTDATKTPRFLNLEITPFTKAQRPRATTC